MADRSGEETKVQAKTHEVPWRECRGFYGEVRGCRTFDGEPIGSPDWTGILGGCDAGTSS